MTASVSWYTSEEVYSCLPREHPDFRDFCITLSWRGPDSYAVIRRGHWYLSTAGKWNVEPPARMRQWHRFTYQQAQALAIGWCPKLVLGPFGQDRDLYYTVDDALNGGFPAYQKRILNEHRQVIR